MPIDIKTIQAMAEAGATGEVIAAAIQAERARDDRLAALKRDKDKLRKREYRNRKRVSHGTNGTSAQPVDRAAENGVGQSGTNFAAENALLYLLPSLTSSSKERGTLNEEREVVRKKGTRLSSDWKPTNGHYAAGAKLGLSSSEVLGAAEDMRLWASANDHRAVARKSNWDMAFSGWMRRNSKGKNEQRNPVMAAFDSLIARADGEQVQGDFAMCDITPRSSEGW